MHGRRADRKAEPLAAADQITPPPANSTLVPAPFSRPGELDLFALVLLLRAHLLRTVLIALACFAATVVYTMRVTPRFSSTATVIIPNRQPTSAASALAVLGGIDILGGGYNVYLDILRSRTVQDELIRKFNLLSYYHTDRMSSAEGALAGATTVGVTPEGLLTITVVDRDPKMAATLANAYSAALEQLNGRLAVTSAGQQRLYYEQQLIKEKDALADAEVALTAVQARTNLVSPDIQASQDLGAVAAAQANRRALVVQLQSLQQGETDQAPDVIRLKAQIAGVSAQIAQLQSGSGQGGPSVNSLPTQTLQVARASREVKFHEGLYDALNKEYEASKEQEGREISVLEVLDPAQPGEVKVWPPRVKFAVYSLIFGLVLGVMVTLLEAFIRAVLRNETNRARLRAFVLAPRG